MPSDEEYQALIIEEVGDTPSNLLAGRIALLWSMYDEVATRPRLRYWYTYRQACQFLYGQYRKQVNIVAGTMKVELARKLQALMEMSKDADLQIERELKGIGGREPVFGASTVTQASDPPNGFPDASNPKYSGYPYATVTKVIS